MPPFRSVLLAFIVRMVLTGQELDVEREAVLALDLLLAGAYSTILRPARKS